MKIKVILSESLITSEKCFQAGDIWECGSEQEAADLVAAKLGVIVEVEDQVEKKSQPKAAKSKGA